MNIKSIVIPLLLSIGMSSHAVAENKKTDNAIAVRASTQGAGLEFIHKLSDSLNIRGGVYGFELGRTETISGIEFDLEAKLLSGGAYLDWYPFKENFHISAGVVYSENEVTGISLPGQSLQIGSTRYDDHHTGPLEGDITANKFLPYLGFGWGNSVAGNKRLKFLIDFGVMFHGTPSSTLAADNIPANSILATDAQARAIFDAELAQESMDFQDTVDDYKVYPILSLGLSYSF